MRASPENASASRPPSQGVTMSDRVTVSREDHLAIVSLNHPSR